MPIIKQQVTFPEQGEAQATASDAICVQPCMVLAHPGPLYAVAVSRAFRRLGWDVYSVQTGAEARRLAHDLHTQLVVLDADLPGESGWLTCAKLTQELPQVKVVLVCTRTTPYDPDFATSVGADALCSLQEGVDLLTLMAEDLVHAAH